LVRQPKTAVFLQKSPKPPRRQGVKTIYLRKRNQCITNKQFLALATGLVPILDIGKIKFNCRKF